jgi:hypothetical protein
MEGFTYTQLKAEVRRRELAALERANKALRLLLGRPAEFRNIDKSLEVNCSFVHMKWVDTSVKIVASYATFHGVDENEVIVLFYTHLSEIAKIYEQYKQELI